MKMADENNPAVLPDDVLAALAEALPPISPPPERQSAMRERLLERVRGDRARQSTVRAAEGEWVAVAPGLTLKLLHRDADTETFLLRMEPGAKLPPHGHALDEACFVVEGTARLGDVHVAAGDYHHSHAGSVHGVVTTDTGAVLLLRAARGVGLAF
jgi:quercetin dioxygenase-like cupin family protein